MSASKPFVLGLTGGIGCGKSEAARFLASLGAAHVDADAISHALTAAGGEALPAIRSAFGAEVFHGDGTLDRAALAQRVFGDEGARRTLEDIIHPLVWERVRRSLAETRAEVVVLDVPLLFESGMDALCDATWVMSADEETQLARIRARDGLSEEEARARIRSQLPAGQRNARAGRVFDTARPLAQTQAELREAYAALRPGSERRASPHRGGAEQSASEARRWG